MGLMYPTEYEHFVKTGTAPAERRPCILCARFAVQDWVLSLRHNWQRLGVVNRNFSVQLYRNLVDQEGGYWSRYVLHPPSNRYEGFMDPIAVVRLSELRARQDEQQGGRWVIEQTPMIYRPEAPLPVRPGEPLQVDHAFARHMQNTALAARAKP